MYNDPEVSAELHRIADSEPLPEFDTNAVLARGHRGLRRRKLLTVGGGVAGVAAIALAATLIPNISSAQQDPGVAGTDSQFGPVPGVPRGEDGIGQRIDQAEAERRCALRYPKTKAPLLGKDSFRSGRTRMYDPKRNADGQKIDLGNGRGGVVIACTIPGGDKPSDALVAAAQADPLPKSAADQLRNCSVLAWADLTQWKIVARDFLDNSSSKNYKAFSRSQLIAVSPSGRTAVACRLPNQVPGLDGEIAALKLDDLGPDTPRMQAPDGTEGKDIVSIVPEGTDCERTICGKSIPTGWGRTAPEAVKVVVQIGTGDRFEVPVHDGWFAFAKFDQKPHDDKTDHLTVRAYDQDGKLVSKLFPERK